MVEWIKKHKVLFIIICIVVFVVLMIGVPFGINLLFKIESNINIFEAEWTAGDALGYYGAVLSFIGTIILGIVAVWQNKKANDLSENVMEISLREKMPYLKLTTTMLPTSRDLELEFKNFGNSFGTIRHIKLEKNGSVILIKEIEHFVDYEGKYKCSTKSKLPNDPDQKLYLNCEFVISNAYGFSYIEIIKMQFEPKPSHGNNIVYDLEKFNILFRDIGTAK